MAGNVWEWCQDWYDSDQEVRVLRGGSWYSYSVDLRVANSNNNNPTNTNNNGFRCVVDVE